VTIYLFGAAWCVPCKRVKAELDRCGIEYRYVDVVNEPGSSGKYEIQQLPTMLAMDGEKEIRRASGSSCMHWVQEMAMDKMRKNGKLRH